MLAALGFLVTIAYWPGISGAATSPRWIVMAGAAVMMLFLQPTRITLAHIAGGIFVLWSLLTFTWSLSPDDTVGMGLHLVLLGMVFCVASKKEDLRSVYIGVALGLVPSGFIAIAQWFGWDGLPQTASPSGFFVNRNFYAEVCALVPSMNMHLTLTQPWLGPAGGILMSGVFLMQAEAQSVRRLLGGPALALLLWLAFAWLLQ